MRHLRVISAITALMLAGAQTAFTSFAEGEEITTEPSVQSPAEEDESPDDTEQEESGESATEAPTEAEASTEPVTETPTESETEQETATEAPTAPATDAPVIEPERKLIPVEPVCEHISRADINGRAIMCIPEGVTAEFSIVYSSPEYDKHVYYEGTLKGGCDYSFEFEGRDITDDDYRWYTVSVVLTGGIYNISSEPYNDTFYIPDGNDNPDSFREINYIFTVDGEESQKTWDIVSSEDYVNKVAFHLDYVKLGDVNNDSSIDSSDASAVLAEYAMLSTGGKGTFSSRQKVAADVNHDDTINSSDASNILAYYSASLTGGSPSWD